MSVVLVKIRVTQQEAIQLELQTVRVTTATEQDILQGIVAHGPGVEEVGEEDQLQAVMEMTSASSVVGLVTLLFNALPSKIHSQSLCGLWEQQSTF